MSQAVLTLHDLVHHWPGRREPTLAIDRLEIAPGSKTFIEGPSGSGKSTLLSLLAGVLQPTEGRICLLGHCWSSLRAGQRDRHRADHVGYIFQQFNLISYLSAMQNVLAPCHFSEKRRTNAITTAGSLQGAARQLLAAMGLSHEDAEQPAGQLSVGQQQRVAAARALIGQPSLIIADEPTSALDDAHRDAFMTQLLGAADAAGSAVVFVSHDKRLGTHFNIRLQLSTLNQAAPGIQHQSAACP